MHAMRRMVLAILFVSQPIASSVVAAQSLGSKPAAASQSGLDLRAMDRSADACTDLFQFACGNWIADNPIPADRSRWGRFDELQERNNDILRKVLEIASTANDPQTKRIGDYYASCMDERAIDKQGSAPMEADLKRIASVDLKTLPDLLGALHAVAVNAFFSFGSDADYKNAKMDIATVGQGGLGLPDRDYYFRDDAKSVETRKEYTDHVGRMLTLTGVLPGDPTARSAAVMRIETALAKGALNVVDRREPTKVYHKMDVAELQKLTPHFEWAPYFKSAGAPAFHSINVAEPDFLEAFDELIGSTSLDDIKTYLAWQLAHASAPVLSTAFVNENFRFYGATLTGAKELRARWKRCVQYTDADLGEALGQAFVKEAFGAQAKADTLKMVGEIEAALDRDIKALDWMTEATKQQALVKLEAVANKIGYPDRWREYSALKIVRGDAYGNSHRANVFEFNRQLAKIDKPVDTNEWLMTPPTVNAYYEPLENNINFPAGILQPPFYSAKADAALNYGGAGAVIGHELTHGFDDHGRQFDASGNLSDWWTPADAKAFEERTACLVDEYSSFSPIEGVTLNGKLTLGENTADNGGLRLALMAYLGSAAAKQAQTLDGFTPEQRVFLGWGQIWCESRRPEYERLQAQTNPHSPGRFRVNGVLSNMPEFQKAFSCKADAPMVRQNACRVW